MNADQAQVKFEQETKKRHVDMRAKMTRVLDQFLQAYRGIPMIMTWDYFVEYREHGCKATKPLNADEWLAVLEEILSERNLLSQRYVFKAKMDTEGFVVGILMNS